MALDLNTLKYGRPAACSKCGGDLRYTGVGEYECTECKNLELDDYGKVRTYIEKNHGATQSQVSQATGVSVNKIRQMLKEEKIEVAATSLVFLHCEMCGTEIRSGKYCPACELKVKSGLETKKHISTVQGFGKGAKGSATGERRFMR